jgi:leader peptidase (prepilin peptidase) / N-methyltransferase
VQPEAVLVVFAAVLGALFGSFLNVVLWRVPRGESIGSPGSHCPRCGTPLRPLELVPVFSWLALRGHCRTCRGSISVRYPLVELACAIVFGIVAVMLT